MQQKHPNSTEEETKVQDYSTAGVWGNQTGAKRRENLETSCRRRLDREFFRKVSYIYHRENQANSTLALSGVKSGSCS